MVRRLQAESRAELQMDLEEVQEEVRLAHELAGTALTPAGAAALLRMERMLASAEPATSTQAAAAAEAAEATSEQGVLQHPGGLPPTVVAGTPSDAVAPGMVVVDAVTVPGTAAP